MSKVQLRFRQVHLDFHMDDDQAVFQFALQGFNTYVQRFRNVFLENGGRPWKKFFTRI